MSNIAGRARKVKSKTDGQEKPFALDAEIWYIGRNIVKPKQAQRGGILKQHAIDTYVFRFDGTLHPGPADRPPELSGAMARLEGRRIVFAEHESRRYVMDGLDRLGILWLFKESDIFTPEKLGTDRSKPLIYEKLAKFAGFKPRTAMYFDSRHENVEAAKSAGFTGVHADCGSIREAVQKLVVAGAGAVNPQTHDPLGKYRACPI